MFVEVRAPNDVREVLVRTSAAEPQLLVVRPGDTVCWNLKVNTAEPLCLVAAQGVQLVSWPMPKSDSLKNVQLTSPSSSSSSRAQNTNADAVAPADAAAVSGNASQSLNNLNASGGIGGAEFDQGACSTTSSENKLATASGGANARERFQRRCLAQLFTEAGMYNVSSRAFTFQNSGGDRENRAAGIGAE